MTTINKAEAINSAMTLAENVAAGKIDPAALEDELVAECRELFGVVAGGGDPLWPLHIDVTRQSIDAGALSADELAEWAAVIRRREQQIRAVGDAETPVAPPEDNPPPDTDSLANGPHSPDSAILASSPRRARDRKAQRINSVR